MIRLSLSIHINQLVLITAREDISLVCFDLKQQQKEQQTTTVGSSTTNALLQNGSIADINEELCIVVDVRKDTNEDLRLWLRGYSKTKMTAVTLGFTFFSPLLFVSDLKTRPLTLKVVNSQGREVGNVKTVIAAKRIRESISAPAAKEVLTTTTTTPQSTTLSHDAVYKDNASSNLYLEDIHETDRFRRQVHNRLSPTRLDETIENNSNSIIKTNETKDGFDVRDKTIAELSRSLDESKVRIIKLEEENVRLQSVVNDISKGIDDFIPDPEHTAAACTTTTSGNNVDSGEDFLSRFQFQKSAMDRKLALLKARLTNPTGENALVNDNRRLGEELEQTRRVAMVASAEMQRMRRDSEDKERKVVSELQSELTKASDVAVSLVAENKHLSVALDEERQQLAIALDRLRPLDANVVEAQREIEFLRNKLATVETELSNRKQRFTDEQIDFDERLQIHKNKIAEMDGVIASFVKKLSESREKETISQETIHALQLVITEAEEQNATLKDQASKATALSLENERLHHDLMVRSQELQTQLEHITKKAAVDEMRAQDRIQGLTFEIESLESDLQKHATAATTAREQLDKSNTEKKALEVDLKRTREQTIQLRAALSTMQASKNVEYEDKIAQLESASEELARKLQVAQESESTASERVEHLETQLAANMQELTALGEQWKAATTQLQMTEAQALATEIRMNSLTEQLAQTQQLVQQSSYELSTVQAQLMEMESQHRAQLMEMESLALEKEQEKSDAALMATHEATTALEAEIVTLNDALSAAITSKTNLTTEINELTQRHEDAIQNMTAEIQSLQVDLEDVRKAKQRASDEHTAVHNALLALQTKFDALIVELRETQEREILAVEQNAKTEQNAKVQNDAIGSKLQADLDQSKADLDQCKADLDQSKAALVQSKADLDQSKADLVQSKADLDQSKADLDQSKAALGQSKADLDQSKAALDQSKAALVQSKADLDQSKADFSMMATRNSSLDGELKDARTQLIALETRAKEQLHNLEIARVQYVEDKDTIAALEREKQSLLNELEKSRTLALKNQTQAMEDHAAAVAVRVENAVLVTKNDALAIDLTRTKEHSDNLSTRVENLQKERDEMKALVSSAEGNYKVELAILTTRNEGLSSELERIKHSEAWKAEADIKSRDALMTLTTEKMTTVAELDKIKVQLATEQMRWNTLQESEQLRFDREYNALRTEFGNSNTVLQDRINELEQQLEHQSHLLTTIEQEGVEKMALLTSQVDAANRQVQNVRTRAAMDAANVGSKHDDEVALLRAEMDHVRIRAETHEEQEAYAMQLQSELGDMQSQHQADKAAWTTEQDRLDKQLETAERATQEVHLELNDVRAAWCEKETAWNVEKEINAAKMADSMSQLQRLKRELEDLQTRYNDAQESHVQANQKLQEELTTTKTQQDEKEQIIITSTNEMNDLRHTLAETKNKLLANEEKFSAAEEERQRLIILENSKSQISAAEMRLTFSEERRKLKEELAEMSGKMGALDSDNTATQKENSFLLCKVLDLEALIAHERDDYEEQVISLLKAVGLYDATKYDRNNPKNSHTIRSWAELCRKQLDEERIKIMTLKHVMMKFSAKLTREDNAALLRAGIILVAGL